ncbi:hypothetical protein GN244_ATG05321 [Phytophthora infestans]|uniref:Uncharacterized protein n=1 Tax=Phytophthora infestans TaxID=4787 RepID=A0A833WMN0_PHYIN|nr:hypothetical protein GN244_ATG05321 [Phytophthora infestans]
MALRREFNEPDGSETARNDTPACVKIGEILDLGDYRSEEYSFGGLIYQLLLGSLLKMSA